MVVLLVLMTFGIFLLIDHFSTHKAAVHTAEKATNPIAAPRLAPTMVAGFQVPENLSYHPGHTWALSESPNLVRIGLDDFAAKLNGNVERIALPMRGQWVRQGQKIWSILRDGKTVDMVSPIEGCVTDVNEAALRNPELASKDPYGEGWLLKVESPDAKINFRNLMNGMLARMWMQNAAQKLLNLIAVPVPVGALAQDGGTAVDNPTAGMSAETWKGLAKEFYLS
jgi:glycine cleavage system H lipoate-binding protein